MLSKKYRLNLKTDFKWVAGGKKIDTKFTKLFIRLGENDFARVGIALTTKVFRKAYQRNRARRVCSAVLEVLYKDLPKNINIVAMPKQNILDVKSGDVLLDIQDSLVQFKGLGTRD